jgi:outer membrane protein
MIINFFRSQQKMKPLYQYMLLFFLLIIMAMVVSGCGIADRYTYPNIYAEYAGPALFDYSDPLIYQEKTDDEGTDVSTFTLEKPLSIDKVISVSLENNPDLNQAHFRIQRAKAMTDLANAAFWPTFGFYTEYMQGDAPSSYLFKTIDQRKLPPDVNFNDPGWFENYETGLNARINLFNSGKDYLALQMAKKEETIANLNRQVIENSLIAQVISTFYDTLAALEFISIARESVSTVAEQLRIMEVRFDGGGALKSDLLSLEVRLAQAKEQLLSSENRYNLTLATLSNLMGLDPALFSEQEGVLEKSFLDSLSIPETYADGIVYALKNRPELARVRQQLIKSRIGLDSARAGYFPRLDLMARYYIADPNMKYNTDRENWIAALMFNWDFFTGFSTPAAIRNAETMMKEMLEADRNAVLGIRLDVKTAYLNFEEAQSRYQVAVSTVDSAEESLRLIKNHYLGGSVPVTRFLEAELDLNRAQIRAANAYYDRIKAASEIARAIGLWSSQPIVPE